MTFLPNVDFTVPPSFVLQFLVDSQLKLANTGSMLSECVPVSMLNCSIDPGTMHSRPWSSYAHDIGGKPDVNLKVSQLKI